MVVRGMTPETARMLRLGDLLTATLADGTTVGPSYLFMFDAGRHPTDWVIGLMDLDLTEHEVWISQINEFVIGEKPHHHRRGCKFWWHPGPLADCPETPVPQPSLFGGAA